MKRVHPQSVVHILGAGSIGCLFGYRLQKAGIPVAMINRQHQFDPLPLSVQEDSVTTRVQLAGFDKSSASIKYLLITTKAHQTIDALQPLRSYIDTNTTLITLQNGLGTQESIQRLFPQNTLLAATTTEGANRPEPATLVHAGKGKTWIGPWQEQATHKAQQLHRWWADALDLTLDQHILQRLWQKLAINCAINPLTVLYDCCNGELLDNRQALRQMAYICEEADKVMRAERIKPVAPLFESATNVALATRNNISSMLQDARRGQPTEIEFINGYVIGKARQHGIACPHNEDITQRVVQLTHSHKLP